MDVPIERDSSVGRGTSGTGLSSGGASSGVGPAAFNPSRLHWDDVPVQIQTLIGERAGSPVVAASSVTQGFSPGYAGVVQLASGDRLFVKAVSAEQNEHSRQLALAEANACAALTAEVPAPRLLWSHLAEWAVLAFEAVGGASPPLPWSPEDLEIALQAVNNLAQCRPKPGHNLKPIAEGQADLFINWRTYAALDGTERDARIAQLGQWGPWVERHLASLVEWESQAPAATAGDALTHCDLRADNMMIDGDQAWIVDWPHAALAAPWADLAFMLPSVHMQGGGDAHQLFTEQPVARGVHPDQVRACVAAFTGFFVVNALEPAPPSIPTLRAFQWGQALASIAWLQALDPSLASVPSPTTAEPSRSLPGMREAPGRLRR